MSVLLYIESWVMKDDNNKKSGTLFELDKIINVDNGIGKLT